MPSNGYYNLRNALYTTLRTQDCEKTISRDNSHCSCTCMLSYITIARAHYLRAIRCAKGEKNVF